MKKRLLFCIICLIYINLYSQDSNYARKIICELSSDVMWGRGYAHNGDSIAADFIINELKEIGAKPLGEEYSQPYKFHVFAMEGKVTLSLNGKTLSPLTDYNISPTAATAHGTFRVIKASNKILFNEKKLKNFILKNQNLLSQSFVYIDITNVKCNDEERKMMNNMLRRLTFNNPIGSRGLLIRTEEMPAWSWTGSEFERQHTLIYLSAKRISKCPENIGADFNNRPHIHSTQNVCAMISGVASPDTFIVLTAHYDHLGCMGDEVIFHGAHDNASGVAAVLDMLRHFKADPPKYSVAALFFSGEEAGLKGSEHYVQNPLFPMENTALLINLDLMCGGDEGITVVNATSSGTKTFFETMESINSNDNLLKQVKPRNNAANSDHYYFSLKAPAIFIYTMGGRIGGYHHWSDTCENCGLENYNNTVTLILQTLEKTYLE